MPTMLEVVKNLFNREAVNRTYVGAKKTYAHVMDSTFNCGKKSGDGDVFIGNIRKYSDYKDPKSSHIIFIRDSSSYPDVITLDYELSDRSIKAFRLFPKKIGEKIYFVPEGNSPVSEVFEWLETATGVKLDQTNETYKTLIKKKEWSYEDVKQACTLAGFTCIKAPPINTNWTIPEEYQFYLTAIVLSGAFETGLDTYNFGGGITDHFQKLEFYGVEEFDPKVGITDNHNIYFLVTRKDDKSAVKLTSMTWGDFKSYLKIALPIINQNQTEEQTSKIINELKLEPLKKLDAYCIELKDVDKFKSQFKNKFNSKYSKSLPPKTDLPPHLKLQFMSKENKSKLILPTELTLSHIESLQSLQEEYSYKLDKLISQLNAVSEPSQKTKCERLSEFFTSLKTQLDENKTTLEKMINDAHQDHNPEIQKTLKFNLATHNIRTLFTDFHALQQKECSDFYSLVADIKLEEKEINFAQELEVSNDKFLIQVGVSFSSVPAPSEQKPISNSNAKYTLPSSNNNNVSALPHSTPAVVANTTSNISTGHSSTPNKVPEPTFKPRFENSVEHYLLQELPMKPKSNPIPVSQQNPSPQVFSNNNNQFFDPNNALASSTQQSTPSVPMFPQPQPPSISITQIRQLDSNTYFTGHSTSTTGSSSNFFPPNSTPSAPSLDNFWLLGDEAPKVNLDEAATKKLTKLKIDYAKKLSKLQNTLNQEMLKLGANQPKIQLQLSVASNLFSQLSNPISGSLYDCCVATGHAMAETYPLALESDITKTTTWLFGEKSTENNQLRTFITDMQRTHSDLCLEVQRRAQTTQQSYLSQFKISNFSSE